MLIFKRTYIDTVSKESFFQQERDNKNEIKDLKHECILGWVLASNKQWVEYAPL